MKTLLIAAFATLALSAGSAFAEGGDGWDMAHMLSRGPVGFETVTKPQASAAAPEAAAIVAHSETTTRNADGMEVKPRMGTPKSADSSIANPALSYPINWGSG